MAISGLAKRVLPSRALLRLRSMLFGMGCEGGLSECLQHAQPGGGAS